MGTSMRSTFEERRSVGDLLTMFLSFFKIGAFTIGGGYAMLPLMEQEFVQNRKWVDPVEIVDVFAVAQSLPGVIAINASIYIGYKVDRIRGALVAALGVILPSFLVILCIAAVLLRFQENLWVQKAFAGVRAGVTALILLAGIKLGKAILKNYLAWGIGIGAFFLLVIVRIQAVVVILASALVGLGTYIWQQRRKQLREKDNP
ncbi:MAG: chromate transporter [Spirochaetes bacterium]|nr:chromate transporter [Spirochaetota bacterium]